MYLLFQRQRVAFKRESWDSHVNLGLGKAAVEVREQLKQRGSNCREPIDGLEVKFIHDRLGTIKYEFEISYGHDIIHLRNVVTWTIMAMYIIIVKL